TSIAVGPACFMRLTRPRWSADAVRMGRGCTGYPAISGGRPGLTHASQTHGLRATARDTNAPMVMASSRLNCHQHKCAGVAVEGMRNVRSKTLIYAQVWSALAR